MVHVLEYTIDSFSSYLGDYHPKKIIENTASNEASRWTSLSTGKEQFVVLRLKKPALMTSIRFGKYLKPHACNLKRFKILVGPRKTQMKTVLEAGLYNNTQPETFYVEKNFSYPVRYIKIIPTQTHGGLFGFSIWYVELWGIQDSTIIEKEEEFKEQQNTELSRRIIKHLKEEGNNDIAELYAKRMSITPEETILTKLHTTIVLNKDMEKAERIVLDLKEKQPAVFEESSKIDIKACWEVILKANQPCGRGGHQLIYDKKESAMILFGGWNGIKELCDLWKYELKKEKWILISENTERDGGPNGRSCHKMVLDTKRHGLYLLGHFSETKEGSLSPDFYFFDLTAYRWTLLSSDVSIEGGPGLLYGHQLAYDRQRDRLIVFGGRVVLDDKKKQVYSGLFFYDIKDRRWIKPAFQPYEQKAIARSDHVMCFDEEKNILFVCSGQRKGEFIGDLNVLDAETGRVVGYCHKMEEQGGPPLEILPIGVFDKERKECVVFVGWMFADDHEEELKPKGKATEETKQTGLWVFNENGWVKANTSKEKIKQPAARYAAQFVYCENENSFYLFGGTTGNTSKKSRLNDLWRLKLKRQKIEQTSNKALFLIRKEIYKSLTRSPNKKTEAYLYFRTKLKETIDLEDKESEEMLKELSGFLFTPPIEEAVQVCFKEIAELFCKKTQKSVHELTELLPL